jgi:hypothetical protein
MSGAAKSAANPVVDTSALSVSSSARLTHGRPARRSAAQPDADDAYWVVPFVLILMASLVFFVTQVSAYA